MTTERTTLADFIAKHGIAMIAKRALTNPNMDSDTQMDHWACSITCNQRKGPPLEVRFSTGLGLRKGGSPVPPTVADVLDCIASDAAGVENSPTFDDWCGEYGYDTDSRKAERTFNACKKQASDLLRLLKQDAFAELLWNTDRL